MRQGIIVTVLLGLLAVGCKQARKAPDVDHIQVNLQVVRFEQEVFNSQAASTEQTIQLLQQKHGAFVNDYLFNLLALPPAKDSVIKGLQLFTTAYKPMFDTVQKQFSELPLTKLKQGLRYVKYYFPRYAVPTTLYTFIGPVEGYSTVLTTSGLAVGLQLYLGEQSSFYANDFFKEIYPAYQSRRFSIDYLAVNCIQNVLEDIHPLNTTGKPLYEQMIEQGKKMYALQMCLPTTPDSIISGYTQRQWEGCEEHEGSIWAFFVQNDLLYKSDAFLLRDYVNDGPKTEALGEGAPGNIGKYVGFKIVQRWMEKTNNTSLEKLLNTPAKQIFDEAKYKPK